MTNYFNPSQSNRVYVKGYAGDPELEERVERCKERGYEEIARHKEQTVVKTFNKRLVYQSTREHDRVTVVLKRVDS